MENENMEKNMVVSRHKNTNRIEYVDIMKAIGIILVIIGHSKYIDFQVKAIIASFHMPLFFFAYGLAIKEKEEYTKESFKKFLISRIRRILVPYFMWALIWSQLSIKNITNIFYGSNETLEYINPHLWFLPCMFLSSVMFELIRWGAIKFKKNKYLVYILTIFICMIACVLLPIKNSGYPFGANIAICATIFIALGNIIKDVVKKVDKVYILLIIMAISLIGIYFYKYNLSSKYRACNYGTSKIL